MIRILMICNLGISTSFVKDRIIAAFEKRGQELDFKAQPRSDLEQLIDSVDMVLIAPQISYLKDEVYKICEDHQKKCFVIPFTLYGNMDGEGIATVIEDELHKGEGSSAGKSS